MWIIEKIKKNFGQIILVSFIFFCLLFNHFTNIKYNKNKLIDYNLSYSGVIIKKISCQKGGFMYFYYNLESRKIIELNPSNEFEHIVIVGDTFYKLKRSNECIIKNKNKNKNIKLEFRYWDY